VNSTILVIEDELAVREAVKFHLERAGFTVQAVETARAGSEALEGVSAVVLDWMLPDEPGIAWLNRLRTSRYASLPVLMLTARASEMDRVDGLDAGADDYLTKPFSAAELAARVRALLRRSNHEQPRGKVMVGTLEINFAEGHARLNGRSLELTRREFDLLAFLTSNLGRVYSRQELLDRVWGQDFMGGERTVDQHITQLRARLEDDPNESQYLETVRGKGYRMKAQSG
jgi:two-component system, OmpR family, response regulator RegX3